LLVRFPSNDELARIVTMTSSDVAPQVPVVASASTIREMGHLARQVNVAGFVTDYIVRLTVATHPGTDRVPEATTRYVRYGVSPRGAQALMMGAKIHALLDGRANVSYGDVRQTAPAALRHRLMLNFEADAAGVSTDEVLAEILDAVPTEGF
jgi:MoxR-like ATPase